MKALVIRQPWAWAVVNTNKPELRAWRITYRGPIAIIAGKYDDEAGFPEVARIVAEHHPRLVVPPREAFVRRAIIGVNHLADVVPIEDVIDGLNPLRFQPEERAWVKRSKTSRFAFRFSHRLPIVPSIPFRGMPGMFNLPADVARHLTQILTHNTKEGSSK